MPDYYKNLQPMWPKETNDELVSLWPKDTGERELVSLWPDQSRNSNSNDQKLIEGEIPFGELEPDIETWYNPNNQDLTDENNPPEWKGFSNGETSILIGYELNSNQINDQWLKVIIGDYSTGQAVLTIKCTQNDNYDINNPRKLRFALEVVEDKWPFYDRIFWQNVKNAGDAMHKISMKLVSGHPIIINYIKIILNSKTILDHEFDKKMYDQHDNPIKLIPHIKIDEIFYFDDIIDNYCSSTIFYKKNKYLNRAMGEYAKSWKTEYGGINDPVGYFWNEDSRLWERKGVEWCGEFLRWVLEQCHPDIFYDLPMNFVKNWFYPRELCIMPRSEEDGKPYRGKIYQDFYPYLGDLIKPGFFVNTRDHITMFIEWVDSNLNPVKFDPSANPQYFLGIGGCQSNKVKVNSFSIMYRKIEGITASIIWDLEVYDILRHRYFRDTVPEEGFTDTGYYPFPKAGFRGSL